MRPRLRRMPLVCALVVGLIGAVALVTFGLNPRAGAHSDFLGSDPADGTVLDGDLSAMTMTFAVEVRDPGSGFVLRIDEGASRVLPATSLDGRSWILTVDPAVSGGPVTITYDVFALDGHRVDGSVTVVTPVTGTGAGDRSLFDQRRGGGCRDRRAG
jgi:methionine-rich copper-binding protein CopC